WLTPRCTQDSRDPDGSCTSRAGCPATRTEVSQSSEDVDVLVRVPFCSLRDERNLLEAVREPRERPRRVIRGAEVRPRDLLPADDDLARVEALALGRIEPLAVALAVGRQQQRSEEHTSDSSDV